MYTSDLAAQWKDYFNEPHYCSNRPSKIKQDYYHYLKFCLDKMPSIVYHIIPTPSKYSTSASGYIVNLSTGNIFEFCSAPIVDPYLGEKPLTIACLYSFISIPSEIFSVPIDSLATTLLEHSDTVHGEDCTKPTKRSTLYNDTLCLDCCDCTKDGDKKCATCRAHHDGGCGCLAPVTALEHYTISCRWRS